MSAAPPLVVEGVHVRLGGALILDGVGFTAVAGQVLAVLGPNGSGKSTLLRCALGLVPREAGRIAVAGRPLAEIDHDERARLLAYVPQHSELQARLSVAEVVAMGRFPHRGGRPGLGRADRAAVTRALAAADVAGLGDRLFDTLSGGERARVLIARALATEAPVMLLDEPTASLDVGHALDCLALLRRLATDGKAIVVVLHDLNQARTQADHAILLDRGRAAACGPIHGIVDNAYLPAVFGVELVPGAQDGFRRRGIDA
jgi:iron complex transport system ATP-binding protein